MRILTFLLAVMPVSLCAQSDTTANGIRFDHAENWEKVKQRARVENKYIFLDLYASWCGPCKMMDRDVYTNDSLGHFMNEHFICVKVQMDSTANDDAHIRAWYQDAHNIVQQFPIQGYPSFLFFNPDGNLAYKDLGFKTTGDFYAVSQKSLDPKNIGYYRQIDDYNKGRKDYPEMGQLAIFAKNVLADNETAMKLAGDYKTNYLDKRLRTKAITKQDLIFAYEFGDLIRTGDPFFIFCYRYPARADSLFGYKGWSKGVVSTAIAREEIDRRLFKNGNAVFHVVDWKGIEAAIDSKYKRADVKSLIASYRLFYYRKIEDWRQWAVYKDKVVRNGLADGKYKAGTIDIYADLNVFGAWDVFLNCNDKVVISKAVQWIDAAIEYDNTNQDGRPNYYDTKANLLYKLGKVDSAIRFEQMSVDSSFAMAQQHNTEQYLKVYGDFRKVLLAMENGKPTYIDEGAKWNKETLPEKWDNEGVEQLPALDTSVFSNWPAVNEVSGISKNGKYAFFQVQANVLADPDLVIQQVNGSWKAEFHHAPPAQFSNDSRTAFILNAGDSLFIVRLGESEPQIIPHVESFKLFMHGNEEWLLYHRNDSVKQLSILNLEDGMRFSYDRVTEYVVSDSGNSVVFGKEGETPSADQSVYWFNTPARKASSVWQGERPHGFVVDREGKQLVFATEDKWWLQKKDENTATLLNERENFGVNDSIMIDRIIAFTTDGTGLIIQFKDKYTLKADPKNVSLDVWSYRDKIVQSKQLAQVEFYGNTTLYKGLVRLADKAVVFWRRSAMVENILPVPGNMDDLMLMNNYSGDFSDEFGTRPPPYAYDVYSFKSAKNTHFNLRNPVFSPQRRFVAGFSLTGQELCCYDFSNGKLYNIDQAIPVSKKMDMDLRMTKSVRFAGWCKEDTALLVYDEYDIWKIDPLGRRQPVNLTNGYGRRHKITLTLAKEGDVLPDADIAGQGLILHAFDHVTKDQGYYRLDMENILDPIKLSMGKFDYSSYLISVFVKAKDSNVWLIRRGNCEASPNFFVTADFKQYHPISNVYPERGYNWLRSELISFKTIDGYKNDAIIFKPQNFNPLKKYPVILHYYEIKSDKLNVYQTVYGNDFMDFSIAWFVSHGYVVVTPDIINHKPGITGLCALNAILGITNYLKAFSWVDTKKIGLQGESFGGFETNYIVANSNKFAAAISSSGMCDDISAYNLDLGHDYWETRQGRMDGPLWRHPDYYIHNSPVLQADHVITPLLTIANRNDGNVPFEQGLEWFLSLRRLGKKIWMLQYDGHTHGLYGNALVDFTLRSQQFFDFYLKGQQAPAWMIDGIPASRKGVDMGLGLEPPGTVPGPGL